MPDNELAHYGVPGMKWGRRKGGSSAPVRVSGDRKASDAIRKKPIESITNKQLKTVNNRLQLEKSYSELSKNPNAIDRITKGNNSVKAVLGIGATAIAAYNMANSPAAKATVRLGKRIFDSMASNPGATDAGFATATRLASKAITR